MSWEVRRQMRRGTSTMLFFKQAGSSQLGKCQTFLLCSHFLLPCTMAHGIGENMLSAQVFNHISLQQLVLEKYVA